MPSHITRIRLIFGELSSSWPLLSQLIRQQMILRYRRTLLGYCWTLINPLMMILIMGFVFSSLFKQDFIKFTAFLFAGMIPWNFISNVVNQS
jgi:ABC-2 type transport system permease protein/lipopolysaccharide transport system permease protein